MFMSIRPSQRRVAFGLSALVLALGTGLPAFAQTATPAPVPDVSQPEPPASALAAARDVVVSSGMSRSFEPMVPQLTEQIVPMLTRTRPELTADLTVVLKDLQPEFVKDGEQMTDIAAHIYARRMSEQELKDTAAFFNSPVGKKYVDIQPAMLDELVVAMQSWTQKLSSIMMTRVRQEMIKKGHNDF
ncbi:DUF2059 domain-containing protein [Lichenihabitans psoromatis]|uniref:DUF2059 domain-containing protein n=1 Tax=Lichenihabitans psoromatis TaxID=2528642 RepID=UPI0010384E4C|nr:DUF2059 domain-containing protein [Lichenihabitans psoromatis]